MRGNLDRSSPDDLIPRSIPARAGEPHQRAGNDGGGWVYPRACGGTSPGETTHRGIFGLSPRVRGNPAPGWECHHWIRSIPARAGEPSGGMGRHSRRAVYPRACGGTRQHQAGVHPPQGLSPRVRGNPLQKALSDLDTRSIPARAGEP